MLENTGYGPQNVPQDLRIICAVARVARQFAPVGASHGCVYAHCCGHYERYRSNAHCPSSWWSSDCGLAGGSLVGGLDSCARVRCGSLAVGP